jgi:outer membrane protein TolC
VRASSDALKALLTAPDHPLEGEGLLTAADSFPEEGTAPDSLPTLADALHTAVERRPELRAALLAIEDAALREEVARDARASRLDLVGRVDLAGEDDAFEDAYGSLVDDDLLGWAVGLSWELPVDNRAAEAQARRARHEARAALIEHEEALQAVVLDVKTALRDVHASRELLAAARATRLAQTENLRTLELERERRSALTPEFLRLLFGAQDRLALAQLEEVGAQATHGRALAALRRAVGTGPVIGRR